MSSVLNVGVMRGNPVGNQIRFLQNQIDDANKRMQMLLAALEAKNSDVFQEYARLRDEADKAAALAANPPPPPRFQASQPTRNVGGRF